MKNRKIKQLISFLIIVCMSIGYVGVSALATEISDVEVSPYNIAVTNTYYDFNIDDSGNASCYGRVSVRTGYTVKLIMQLQKKGSMWVTVQSWNDTGTGFVVLDKEHVVDGGNKYRLMLIYNAYDANGNVVESLYDLSNVVEYK